MAKQRKLRRDAVLKKLDDPEKRKQVAEWLEEDGWESCAQRIASEVGITFKGQPVSRNMIYEAIAFWRMEAISNDMFRFRDAQADLMQQFRPGDATLAREWGEFALLQRANEAQDKDIFCVATMAQDSRRRLDLEEKSGKFKAKVAVQKLAQKDRDFSLQREKFITESCEKIIKAARDPKVREIVEDSKLSNAEKIAEIRQAYFADIDAVKVELPE